MILTENIKDKIDLVTSGSAFTFYDDNENIIEQEYYKTLLDNFKEGLELLINYRIKVPLNINNKYSLYNIDEYWQKLQKKDKWYIVAPSICIQRNGYSDCIKGMANYRKNEF